MIFGKIQSCEIMPIIFNFRSFRKVKTDALKDFDDALTGSGKQINVKLAGKGAQTCKSS